MKSKLIEILKSLSNYGLAIIFMRLTPFFTIPLILKNLSLSEYGKLGGVQAIVMTVVSFSTLNVASSNFRFFKYGIGKYSKLYNRLLVNTSNLIILISISLISILSLFILPKEFILSGFLLILSQSFYTYFLSLIRAQNKSKIYSLIEIGKNSIYFLILFLLIHIDLISVKNILLSFTFCNLFFLIVIILILYKQKWINLAFSKLIVKRTLLYSLPTLAAYVIQAFLQQSPLIMIATTDENLGLINYANKISLIIFALQSIVFLAWPYFSFKYQEEKLHRYVFKTLTVLLVVLSWIIYFFFDYLTLIISNESFLIAKQISIGFICVYIISILGNLMDTSANIANKTYLISLIFIVGLFIGLLGYSSLPYNFLIKYPYMPLLLSFLTMTILRVIIYTKKNLFKSWDNNFLSLAFINSLILFLIS